MLNKYTYMVVVIFLLIIIVIAYFIFFSRNYRTIPVSNMPQKNFSNDIVENFLKNDKESRLLLAIPHGICYWFSTSSNETAYLISISKFNSSSNCFSNLIGKKDIIVQKNVNIFGDTDCLCDGSYILEKNITTLINLKISKVIK